MNHRPGMWHGLVALAACALVVWLLSVRIPAAVAATYEVNDSHFHLTNDVQERTNIHEFLRTMGTTGEFTIHQEFVSSKIADEKASPTNRARDRRLDFAGEVGLVPLIHNNMETESFMLQWLPTTGAFGLYGTLGDYDDHQMVAIRFGAHYAHSLEDTQSQPGANSIENSQNGIASITDDGYQLQFSAMVVPKAVQLYFGGSQIFGRYGDASEIRFGGNWSFTKERGLRVNTEVIHLNHSPVGYTAVPYPVGGNGNVFHVNLEMNF